MECLEDEILSCVGICERHVYVYSSLQIVPDKSNLKYAPPSQSTEILRLLNWTYKVFRIFFPFVLYSKVAKPDGKDDRSCVTCP